MAKKIVITMSRFAVLVGALSTSLAGACVTVATRHAATSSGSGLVAFVVRDGSGHAIPGVTVTIFTTPGARDVLVIGVTDSMGIFRAAAISATSVDARFDLEGFYSITVHAVAVRDRPGLPPLEISLVSRAPDVSAAPRVRLGARTSTFSARASRT